MKLNSLSIQLIFIDLFIRCDTVAGSVRSYWWCQGTKNIDLYLTDDEKVITRVAKVLDAMDY
jgi:hypothetical protein